MGKASFTLYKVTVFIAVLSSMNAYLLWGVPSVVITFLCVLMGFLPYVGGVKPIYKNYYVLCFVPILVLAVLKFNIVYFLSQLFLCISILQILALPSNYKRNLLNFNGFSLASILLISLVAWVVNLFVVETPVYDLIDYRNTYFFENHILFLRLTNITGYYRFISIFIEPGHLSMFCVFFLYAMNFDFKKWYTWVFLLSILFSLSLAGYILLVVGFLLNSIQRNSAIVKRLAFFLFLLVGGYWLVVHYGGEDNIVYEKIFLRMEADDETVIAGNNRTDSYTNDIFTRFVHTNDVWTGYGLQDYQQKEDNGTIQGAGYKMYIFRNGIIGVFACFFFYFYLAYKSDNRRYMMLFLILFAIAFLQRAYPFWIAWLLPFLCTIQPQKRKSSIIKLNRV